MLQTHRPFPDYQVGVTEDSAYSKIITVLTKQEAELVPEDYRADFVKSGEVTVSNGKKQQSFITKIKGIKINDDTLVEFSPEVQALPNYFGIASQLLAAAYKFGRKHKPTNQVKVFLKQGTKNHMEILSLVQSRNRSKEWANGRGDIEGTPQYFVKEATRISQTYKVKLTVLQGEQLLQQRFNLMHSVGRASINPPAFINLAYNGNPDSDLWVAFIGKGVCFDSGGLDIKSADMMKVMFLDKHGATNVLSAFETIVSQKVKINLTCSVGMVENVINANAYRPSDLITSRKGLTVEIGNTDAEGRLVLADCMNWTQENYKVDVLIEESTLTGAIIIALGNHHAGLFGNDEALNKAFCKAGKQVNEQVWEMPVTEYHHELIKSTVADITNHSGHKQASSSQAAAFLNKFVKEGVKWIHLDIAGTAIVSGEGSGADCKILVQYARNYANGV